MPLSKFQPCKTRVLIDSEPWESSSMSGAFTDQDFHYRILRGGDLEIGLGLGELYQHITFNN